MKIRILLHWWNNPNIERIKKSNLIDASFVGVNKHIINVVKILADNLQISLINFVLEQFDELYSRYSNSVVVKCWISFAINWNSVEI